MEAHRALTFGMSGDDVARLHEALEAVGIEVGERERAAKHFGDTTREAVTRMQLLLGQEATGEVDPATLELAVAASERLAVQLRTRPRDPHAYIIEGAATDGDARPLAGATVVAYRVTLRDEDELASGTTDENGHYHLTFRLPPTTEDRKAPESLTVRLRLVDAAGAELLDSGPHYGIAQHAVIALSVGGTAVAAEFNATLAAIVPRLGRLRLDQLEENEDHRDLTFLGGETGVGKTTVAMHAVASRLEGTTGLPSELFYGLLRLNVLADAEVRIEAEGSDGADLDRNAQRVLDAVLRASPDVRANALDVAIKEGVVSPSYAERVSDDLEKLKGLAVDAALDASAGTGKTSMREVLKTATRLPDEKQRVFVERWSNAAGSMRQFWRDLVRSKDFEKEEVAGLRFAMAVGRMTRGHLPLVEVATKMLDAGTITSARDFARLDLSAWKAIIVGDGRQPGVGIPENFTARDDETAVDAYARLLHRSFERAYPTTAFAAQLAADEHAPVAAKDGVVAFLDANPEFDLRRTSVDRFLKDKPDALNGNREEVRDGLLTTQRVIKLASRYAAAKPLLEDGIHTAQQIYSMGPSRFQEVYGTKAEIGTTEAVRIFGVAEQTYAMSLVLTTRLAATLREVNPAAIGNLLLEPRDGAAPAEDDPLAELAAFPNLQTLFGSLDLCACKHCRSVLSPAAYFVDMMRFLDDRVTAGRSAKQVLLERRPDLDQIELSCPNTNTVLPYIDLVNELLEDAVAPPANLKTAARARQTTLDTPELNANPQYVNDAAYAKLAGAVHPFGLPFDLPLLEARTYLGQLGTSRLRLMRALRPAPAVASTESTQMAIEALGLSALEADIVIGGALAAGHEPWDYWGLHETGNTVQDPVETTTSYAGTWIEVLGHARILLSRAQLTHAELQKILNTRFVNPGGSVTTSDTCDLGAMSVNGLTRDVLDRLHRFLRLMRKLEWDPYDLDTAIERLQADKPAGAGRLNAELLRQLRALSAAVVRFAITPRQAVALFAGIDTYAYPALPGDDGPTPSLYDELFQNPGVLNPVDPVFKLNAARSEIDGAGPALLLADHRSTLVAAFELSDPDVSLAVGALPSGELTLSNLAALYRHVLLARGLDATTQELITLRALAEMESTDPAGYEAIDPFDPRRPELLERFCEAVDAVRRTRLDVAQLDYLLRNRAAPGTGIAPDDITVGTLIKSVREGLAKIAKENTATPDPTGALVRARLTALLAPADVPRVMAVLDGSATDPEASQRTLVEEQLGAYMPAADAGTQLVGAAALAAGAERYAYVLERLARHARITLGTGLVVQQLAEALGLETATVKQLAGSWFADAGGATLLSEFLALPTVVRDAANDALPVDRSEAGFAEYFTAYARLAKAAQAIAGHNLTAAEVAWYEDHGVAAGWLDLTALPHAAPTATPEGRFVRWLWLEAAERVKASVPVAAAPFGGLFSVPASKADHFALLEERLECSREDLEALAGAAADATQKGTLNLTFPADYANQRALAALLPALAELRRLGVAAAAANQWAAPTVAAPQAAAIKRSVKARYTTAEWPEIAKPLRDVLREAQRDALVAYLLTAPPPGARRWQSANDVYAHFLIDVEMSACQGTSRIVQANATVQLFVQRCVLNLEPDVKVDAKADGHWLEWRWMSRYRVWEANRKVFLYPENWIEPGLRTDKSPFFRDMENELLQTEITNDSAERALHNYLVGLDAVARLDVVGTYFEPGTPNRLHVIGRKQGDPPTYYHREWIDSTRWTAWRKIDLDIVSDHVLPVVWNRRPYLFWAIVTRKADQAQNMPRLSPSNEQPPATKFHLEVQLAWSEFRDKKWQAKQTAPQTFVINTDAAPRNVTLKSALADPLLRIDIFADVVNVGALTGDADARSNVVGIPFAGTYLWTSRSHVGEFVLGGVGNTVEAFAVTTNGLAAAGGAGVADIGALPSGLQKGALHKPAASVYNGMTLAPVTTTVLNSARPRVSPCNTSYDLYGALVSETVLDRADRYRLLIPHQLLRFDSSLPFFYADNQRSYFVIPRTYYQNGNYFETTAPAYVYRPHYRAQYKFAPNYHAFVPLFIRQLNAGGVDRFYERDLQRDPAGVQGIAKFDFKSYYGPTNKVIQPYPNEGVDFDPDAPYSIYNWELFYHAPFQVGESLSVNQRFEEAKHWYEYVFDPTSAVDEPAPRRYWVTKPFNAMTGPEYQAQEIKALMQRINARDPAVEHQVAQWRTFPFEPHVIAGLRPVAYQRAIVMKYIDNLIAWGDQLFRQDTMESVNEATQLYVLAAELLGPKPEIIQPSKDAPAKTFADIAPDLDDFGNAAIAAAENAIAPVQVNVPTPGNAPQLPVFPPLYFCIPPNEKLLGYWDTVADRLFKIRHCMNIEGVVRQLALFAPPIDPAMLVRAAAAGLDLGSVLSESSAPLPPYRFAVMMREAMQLADMVRSLGGELLVALEKRDAETLSLIRSASEKRLQKAVVELRDKTIEGTEKQIAALAKSREVIAAREQYFATRQDDLMNGWEAASLVMTGASLVPQAIATVLDSAAGAAHMVPEVQAGASGAGGSPHATVKIGGPNVGRGTSRFANAMKVVAAVLQTGAAMSSVVGGYERRKDDWTFQHDLASKELDAIDAQKLTLQIQRAMAEKEKRNEETILALVEETDEFLRDRFTNRELYDWMVQQTSATYFQAYRLAYSVAKQAEGCMRRELGLKPSDTSYIQFGYWDSLKRGLLSGDKLKFDLQRMEAAYLAENTRELEIVKHVSLLQVDPTALVRLRSKGACTVKLPELLFDLDTPGHYMRRLKAVAISVPSVVGPYGNVRLTATLHANEVRTSPSVGPGYARAAGDDPRFVDDQGGFASIVTSSGQNDHGLFEVRLDDERYLPFEGQGAVGTWQLKLGGVRPQFDHDSITDVVLHLRYTARDGGEPLATAAGNVVRAKLNEIALAESRKGLYKLVSPRQDMSTEWQAFLTPPGGGDQVLAFNLGPDRFPFFTHGMAIKVAGMDVYAKLGKAEDYTLQISRPGAANESIVLQADANLGGVHHGQRAPLAPKSDLGRAPTTAAHPWSFKLKANSAGDFRSLTAEEVEDLAIVLHYEVTP